MSRGNQIIRQWRVLRLIEQSRTGLRAREIHDLLDGHVTERTIFRDLRDLQAAGFPLYEDGGRWRALEVREGGYSIPVDASELLALLLSEELLAPIRSAEVVSALVSLRGKVSSLLTPVGRNYAEELKGHLIATFVGPGDYGDSPVVRAVEDAIHRQHRVSITYWSPNNGLSEREVDPYLLWYADARLYLVGWCRLRDALRTFLIDRVRAVEVLDREFEPDPSFDPRVYAASGLGAWSGERHRVVLEFTPQVAHLVAERRFHPTQQAEPCEDGSALVTMHISGLPHIAAWVASFGGRVKARAPAGLVQLIREIHTSGLAAHRDPDAHHAGPE